MGHTNSTANLALPQFIGTDKPTWLGDINGAFAAIDAYAGTNDAAVASAVSDASSAVSQASTAVNTANTANTTAGNASTAANNAIGVANTASNLAGAVDTKVGLLINLNTTDKSSIVNAINEVKADANPGSVSVTADGVKDYETLLNELHALVDLTKITTKAHLVRDDGQRLYVYMLSLFNYTSGTINFNEITGQNTIDRYECKTTGSAVHTFDLSNSTDTDNSSIVPGIGYKLEIYY